MNTTCLIGHFVVNEAAGAGGGEEWHAARGDGAWLGDERLPQLPPESELEMLGMEMIHPGLLVDAARAIQNTGASRLRALAGALAERP